MKAIFVKLVVLLLLAGACGSPSGGSSEVAETDEAAQAVVSAEEPDNVGSNAMLPFPEKSKIQLILEGEQETGQGIVNGKPFDVIIGADAIHLQFGDKRLHSHTEQDTYFFYKQNKHYPKLLKLADDRYLYLLEAIADHPSEDNHLEGWFFSSTRFIRRINFKEEKLWQPDMSRDYSEEELWEVISRIPFSD